MFSSCLCNVNMVSLTLKRGICSSQVGSHWHGLWNCICDVAGKKLKGFLLWVTFGGLWMFNKFLACQSLKIWDFLFLFSSAFLETTGCLVFRWPTTKCSTSKGAHLHVKVGTSEVEEWVAFLKLLSYYHQNTSNGSNHSTSYIVLHIMKRKIFLLFKDICFYIIQ